ncbi:MAG: hypothetical protein Q9195_007101 [Heterodermia aff. obscurata]
MHSTLLLALTAIAAAAPSNLAPRQQSFSASFTQYSNCGPTTACGLTGGFTAAASQNLFGVGPGAGAGPACGTCYSLSSNQPGTAPITVKITDLCPADGNPLCAQQGLSGTNSAGANVNFDLCADGGAAAAFFGSSGTTFVTGSATQVGC